MNAASDLLDNIYLSPGVPPSELEDLARAANSALQAATSNMPPSYHLGYTDQENIDPDDHMATESDIEDGAIVTTKEAAGRYDQHRAQALRELTSGTADRPIRHSVSRVSLTDDEDEGDEEEELNTQVEPRSSGSFTNRPERYSASRVTKSPEADDSGAIVPSEAADDEDSDHETRVKQTKKTPAPKAEGTPGNTRTLRTRNLTQQHPYRVDKVKNQAQKSKGRNLTTEEVDKLFAASTRVGKSGKGRKASARGATSRRSVSVHSEASSTSSAAELDNDTKIGNTTVQLARGADGFIETPLTNVDTLEKLFDYSNRYWGLALGSTVDHFLCHRPGKENRLRIHAGWDDQFKVWMDFVLDPSAWKYGKTKLGITIDVVMKAGRAMEEPPVSTPQSNLGE